MAYWNRRALGTEQVAVLDTYRLFIEPEISLVSLGISGYIWLDTKIVFKKREISKWECH